MLKLPHVRVPFTLVLSTSILLSCGRGEGVLTQHVAPQPTPPQNPGNSDDATDALTDPPELTGWQKDWWMEKTARKLGNGDLKQSSDGAQLRTLGRREFVENLVSTPGFVDTTLEFNLFFLGMRKDKVRDNNGQLAVNPNPFFQPSVAAVQMPQALASAQAVGSGGDFLTLLHYDQPIYPDLEGFAFLRDGSDQKMSQAEVRATLRQIFVSEIATARDLANATPFDKDKYCKHYFGVEDNYGVSGPITSYGLPLPIELQIFTSPRWFRDPVSYCFTNNLGNFDLKANLEFVASRGAELFDLADSWQAGKTPTTVISEIKPIDVEHFGLAAGTAIPVTEYFVLQNSSTNYDRRRAAYILKRYFCDDLTPISVALPAEHARDKHASDPSCQACHYKLDPMAGFFRTRGTFGSDFTGQETITFDDGAKANLDQYESHWVAPEGAGRKWDIGYVRSAKDPSLNSYGESLQDLFGIIAEAPEVRQCLVRRMFEFYVGENQAIDPGYLAYLTGKFNEEAASNSTDAYKHTVERILLGKSFSEPDLVSNECYDYAPGPKAEHAPPCKVNFILQKECSKCHSGKSPNGGLDLTNWIELSDGSRNFPHTKDGQQVDRASTLKALYGRLTTTDESERMPLGADMPAPEREQLVLWLNGEMKSQGGH